jgi:hypothetical protein
VGTPFTETALAGKLIIAYEPALARYAAWYAPEKAEFYRAWLHDHLYLEDSAVETIMTQWEQDRGSAA